MSRNISMLKNWLKLHYLNCVTIRLKISVMNFFLNFYILNLNLIIHTCRVYNDYSSFASDALKERRERAAELSERRSLSVFKAYSRYFLALFSTLTSYRAFRIRRTTLRKSAVIVQRRSLSRNLFSRQIFRVARWSEHYRQPSRFTSKTCANFISLIFYQWDDTFEYLVKLFYALRKKSGCIN